MEGSEDGFQTSKVRLFRHTSGHRAQDRVTPIAGGFYDDVDDVTIPCRTARRWTPASMRSALSDRTHLRRRAKTVLTGYTRAHDRCQTFARSPNQV